MHGAVDFVDYSWLDMFGKHFFGSLHSFTLSSHIINLTACFVLLVSPLSLPLPFLSRPTLGTTFSSAVNFPYRCQNILF